VLYTTETATLTTMALVPAPTTTRFRIEDRPQLNTEKEDQTQSQGEPRGYLHGSLPVAFLQSTGILKRKTIQTPLHPPIPEDQTRRPGRAVGRAITAGHTPSRGRAVPAELP
jgi:hypothetical protein